MKAGFYKSETLRIQLESWFQRGQNCFIQPMWSHDYGSLEWANRMANIRVERQLSKIEIFSACRIGNEITTTNSIFSEVTAAAAFLSELFKMYDFKSKLM